MHQDEANSCIVYGTMHVVVSSFLGLYGNGHIHLFSRFFIYVEIVGDYSEVLCLSVGLLVI